MEGIAVSTAQYRPTWKTRAFSAGAAVALLLSAAAAPRLSASAAEFDVSVSSIEELSGLTAIAGGDGDGVNVRAEPSLGGDVVATVPDGTVVTLRVDVTDTVRADGLRWWPVIADGRNGWIAGPWLMESDGRATQSTSDSPSRAGFDPEFGAGSYVRAVTDDETGVNVRSEPDLGGDVLTGIPHGAIAQVMDGPFRDDDGGIWYKVTDGETTGYASAEWLSVASGPAADADVQSAFAIDSWVKVATDDGTGLNLRADASRNGSVVDTLRENARLQIIDGPMLDRDGMPWYEVIHGDDQGFVIGTYLEKSSAPSSSSSRNNDERETQDDSDDRRDTAPAPQAGVATGSFRFPIDNYTVTQEFGCSYLGYYSYNDAWGCPVHDGLDLAAPMYTNILAADGGTVTAAGWCDCGLGYYVQIDHGNGFSTIYGHMAEQPYVSVGQAVAKGDVIGPVGSTGASTGPHTHFMLLQNGGSINPRDYLS
jgi:murein DD-endopeptidase MepM/ murein hydrolase activator NlpD